MTRRSHLSNTTAAAALLLLAACGGTGAYPTRDGSMDVKRERGLINVNGEFNICPDVVLVASPARARVGTSVEVSAKVSDEDEDPLGYRWEADSGSFANPAAADTTFLCAAPGVRTITLTVSDGSCEPTQTASVTCVAPAGDGGAPDGDVIDTVSDRRVAAVSDGGGTDSGRDAGMPDRSLPAHAVDVRVVPDPPGGGDPTRDEGAICNDCTSMQCDPMTDGCDLLTDGVKRQQCHALYACIRHNSCSEAGDPTSCWCGTSAYAMCISVPGAANGPCAVQVQEAADSHDPAIIKQRFVSPMFPVGGAVNLSVCRGSFCIDECR